MFLKLVLKNIDFNKLSTTKNVLLTYVTICDTTFSILKGVCPKGNCLFFLCLNNFSVDNVLLLFYIYPVWRTIMKMLFDEQNFVLGLAAVATLLCFAAMLIMLTVNGTHHLGYMLFNMLLIGSAWLMVFKERIFPQKNG